MSAVVSMNEAKARLKIKDDISAIRDQLIDVCQRVMELQEPFTQPREALVLALAKMNTAVLHAGNIVRERERV